MYQSAIARPVTQSEGADTLNAMRRMNRRFVGFVWMSAWTVGTTGILMMLFDPRFVWFQYNDRWSILLGMKELVFVLMVFYAFGYARMLHYIMQPSSNGGFDEKTEIYAHKIHQFRTISIALGILAMLLSGGMR